MANKIYQMAIKIYQMAIKTFQMVIKFTKIGGTLIQRQLPKIIAPRQIAKKGFPQKWINLQISFLPFRPTR
jgi:hypothetical protein